jgi:hypothetical protein
MTKMKGFTTSKRISFDDGRQAQKSLLKARYEAEGI